MDKSPCPAVVRYVSKLFKTGQKSHECGDGHTQNQFSRNSSICSAHNSDNNSNLNCIVTVACSPVICFSLFFHPVGSPPQIFMCFHFLLSLPNQFLANLVSLLQCSYIARSEHFREMCCIHVQGPEGVGSDSPKCCLHNHPVVPLLP